MTKIRHDRLLWLDLETSCTDENATEALILEIGLTVTTFGGQKVSEKNIVNSLGMKGQYMHRWEDAVLSMHVKNGLLAEVKGKGVRDIDLTHEVVNWLTKWEKGTVHDKYNEALDGPPLEAEERITLAGSGVSHFDRRWVRRFLPAVDNRLTHYGLDVGVQRRYLEMFAPEVAMDVRQIAERGVKANEVHRALTCNRIAIAAHQMYVGMAYDIKSLWREKRTQRQVLCGAVGPGDTCTYGMDHYGKHSWE